jgi:hypothetical protein
VILNILAVIKNGCKLKGKKKDEQQGYKKIAETIPRKNKRSCNAGLEKRNFPPSPE